MQFTTNPILYIYNSPISLKRTKDYILKNNDSEEFFIYLQYPVLEGQFSVKFASNETNILSSLIAMKKI